MKIFKTKKKKNKKKTGFYFNKTSMLVIWVCLFWALVIIFGSLMSVSSMNKYARSKVFESRILSERRESLFGFISNWIMPDRILIGDGVVLSASCKVSERSIICHDS